MRCIASMAFSSFSAVMVAMAAAMGTAENQNEPVTKTFFAPSRNASLPSTAASARPFAIALLQADRSGSTPTGSQLDPRCRRNPARTSSRISAAPFSSHRVRSPRAKAGSTSSWSYPASCLNGLTRMPARSSPASAAARCTLARSLKV